MKAGILGWPESGRDAIFCALTGLPRPPFGHTELRQGEALVPDSRLDHLSSVFKPKKHSPAKVEFFLPKAQGQPRESLKASLEKLREADVLILVLRNFQRDGEEAPDVLKDAAGILSELVLSDYLVVEKRLERLAEEAKRGKKGDPEELDLLKKAKELLEGGSSLRSDPAYSRSPKLKGFAFLSAKPVLAVINNADDDDQMPPFEVEGLPAVLVRGQIEEELGQMSPEEAREFLADYGLSESAASRIIKEVYRLMGLISFFTVGEDECRAWTINRGDSALEAAGAIHSDIQKGFIRAEVVSYDDFLEAGNFNEAKKKGSFRLEGKTYPVADGDIVHFRFNV